MNEIKSTFGNVPCPRCQGTGTLYKLQEGAPTISEPMKDSKLDYISFTCELCHGAGRTSLRDMERFAGVE